MISSSQSQIHREAWTYVNQSQSSETDINIQKLLPWLSDISYITRATFRANMRVLSWSKKLSLSSERSRKVRKDNMKCSRRTSLRVSVSSISRFLSSSSLPLLRRPRAPVIPDHESPVLQPLTITITPRPRAATLAHTREMRTVLQQRFTQRILERSRASVILEARQEMEREGGDSNTTHQEEDVYVPFDFHQQRLKSRIRERQPSEETVYMTMS